MNRAQKRATEAVDAKVISKAKKDMSKWFDSLDRLPPEHEVRIWQAGYLAGLNRSNKD